VRASDLEASLQSLAGAPLSSNLKFALKDWEAEHRSLRLWKGMVLCVGEDRRHLVEHTEHFAQAVVHEFAPGVWLVREDLLEMWSRELEQKGLPPLPALMNIDGDRSWGRPWSFSQWALVPAAGPALVWPAPAAPASMVSDRIEALLKTLEASQFPEDEKEEWRARILRRVVLTPDQLEHPLGRGERLEARGLDYTGKVRLAELAVASTSDLLEVSYRDEEGAPGTKLVRPVRLDRQAGEALLIAEDLETRKPFQAWISRLSQVRKIKGSLLS
jgi:hypothetical protein